MQHDHDHGESVVFPTYQLSDSVNLYDFNGNLIDGEGEFTRDREILSRAEWQLHNSDWRKTERNSSNDKEVDDTVMDPNSKVIITDFSDSVGPAVREYNTRGETSISTLLLAHSEAAAMVEESEAADYTTAAIVSASALTLSILACAVV